MEHKPVITFLGAGNMASSLIGGLIADQYPCNKIWGTNPQLETLQKLKQCFNINITDNNSQGVDQADVLVLAVKPSVVKPVIEEIKSLLQTKKPLILSIVTGIRSDCISKWASCDDLPIVRSMPNTPALLRSGVTGLWANSYVTDYHLTQAESILRAVGVTLWVKREEDLDAVTAISGSGPAYFFLVMETMIDSAIKMGFSNEQAQLLTINTALGAARMALESGKNVKSLRKQVTSPGGTTEQAINIFESGGMRELFDKALQAAKLRATEMSHLLE